MRERVSVDSLASYLYTCLRAPVYIPYMHVHARTMQVFIQNKTTVLIHYGYAGIRVRVHAHVSICVHVFCRLTGPATILFLSVLINISRRWLRKGH